MYWCAKCIVSCVFSSCSAAPSVTSWHLVWWSRVEPPRQLPSWRWCIRVHTLWALLLQLHWPFGCTGTFQGTWGNRQRTSSRHGRPRVCASVCPANMYVHWFALQPSECIVLGAQATGRGFQMGPLKSALSQEGLYKDNTTEAL
jgi:hypothetical protein